MPPLLNESTDTSGGATQRGAQAMRVSVVGAAAAAALLFVSLAIGASSYTDAAGDHNEAPDITSVELSEAADGLVTIVIGVRNYQALPDDSWFNLWFDLDSDPNTGDAGDETLVRYVSTGALEIYDFDGAEMIQRPLPAGITGRFSAGVLTITVPKVDLGGDTIFGVLAVSSRRQALGETEFIASDFSPDRGRSAYTGPAQAAYPDPSNDEDAAPDITSVRATDDRAGWITLTVATPNYASLPGEAVLAVAIDRDSRPSTGDAGAELLLRSIGGELAYEKWDASARGWVQAPRNARVRLRSGTRSVAFEIHRSELQDAARFGFSITALDVNTQAESVLAADLAPDNGGFYRYTLANKPTLRLTVQRLFATPARPRAGKPFAVKLAVRRSDTNRAITSGVVTCRVLLDGKRVRARGSVAGGAAQCALVVPNGSAGQLLRGSIAVRVSGKSTSADFAYTVR
jgi:hypothetical protein